MALVSTFRGQAVPLYGRLLIVDPSMSGADEPDLRRALDDADAAIIGGSRWRAAVKAGQDTVAIGVIIELWDAQPDAAPARGWAGPRELTVEFPRGALILENISSGPVPLEPGSLERVTLSSGAGLYHVRAWHSGREQAAAAVAELWEADDAGEDVSVDYAELAGIEEYLLQIWPRQ